jgi:Heparinase II/III-like protein
LAPFSGTTSQAIVTKGLLARDFNYLESYETAEKLNNWANVCAGGLLAGALAVGDDEPRIAAETIESAMKVFPRAIDLWMPDGAWEEGTVYSTYALLYTRVAIESLRRACGSTFDLDRVAGLHLAGNGLIFLSGPESQSFAFADSGYGLAFTSMLWLGQTFNQPVLHQTTVEYSKDGLAQKVLGTYEERETKFGYAEWDDVAGLLYLNPPAPAGKPLPLDQYFRGQEIAAFRERWNDPSAAYLAIKGGANVANHNNLDLGTFVFGGDGVAWAVELGADDYGLEGYFDAKTDEGKRWTFYRARTEGQNTLVMDERNQPMDGETKITMFDSSAERGMAVLDLTSPYRYSARSTKRGVCLKRDGRVALIQDEIETKNETDLTRTMHTRAEVKIDGKTAMLSANGKTCNATILSPPDAFFILEEVNLTAPQKPTPGLRKIMIRLGKLSQPTTVAVELRLGGKGESATVVVPLTEWAEKM